jgi:hypothetical protein
LDKLQAAQELARLKGVAALFDGVADAARDLPESERRNFYTVWGGRYFASLARARRAAANRASANPASAAIDELSGSEKKIEELLNSAELLAQIRAHDATAHDTGEILVSAMRQGVLIAAEEFRGARQELAIPVRNLVRAQPLGRQAAALLILTATAGVAVFGRRAGGWDLWWRWPSLVAAVGAVVWWLWLWPSALGWILLGACLLAATGGRWLRRPRPAASL